MIIAGSAPRLRVLLAALLALGSIWLAQMVAPQLVRACSCVPTEPDAPILSGEESAVFVGTAGAEDARGRVAFTVERWYQGGSEPVVLVQSAREVFADGTSVINTCGLTFEPGVTMIMVAGWSEGVLIPGSCAPHARIDSAEGQRLMVAAVDAFGEGIAPGEPPPDVVTEDNGSIDVATIAFLLVGAVVALGVLALIVAVARGARANESS
jgi:hypothetical protein